MSHSICFKSDDLRHSNSFVMREPMHSFVSFLCFTLCITLYKPTSDIQKVRIVIREPKSLFGIAVFLDSIHEAATHPFPCVCGFHNMKFIYVQNWTAPFSPSWSPSIPQLPESHVARENSVVLDNFVHGDPRNRLQKHQVSLVWLISAVNSAAS